MATANNRQSFVRQERIPVSSAIPSVTLTLASLPARPKPTGSLGIRERVYTNHFACSFGTNIVLYQYDVSIEEIGTRSKDWYEVKGRGRCAATMQQLISTNRFGPQVVVWYDEQKCLYSTSHLPSPQIIISQDGQSRLNIKALVNQSSTNDMEEYINGQAATYPHDAVRILETLLKKSIQDRVQVVNNVCYFNNMPPTPLAGGFEERRGFIQALNLASKQLTLNVQTKLTTFYRDVSLLEFIAMQIGPNRIPSDDDYKKLSRMLKNCLVVTQQSGWTQAYEIDRFDERRPQDIQIESGKTLVDYYKNDKKIPLKHTAIRCLQVYLSNDYTTPRHLPVEVCRIKPWQVYDKPLSKAQEAQQPRKFIPNPEQRYLAIMDTVSKCDYNSITNRLCREVGFRITDSTMLTLDTRVLMQPQIQTGPNHQANVRIGRIPLNGHLFTPKPISSMVIAYFGTDHVNKESIIKRFRDDLVGVMQTHHVIVTSPELHDVQPIIESVDRFLHAMSDRKCQLVVCVMDGRMDDDLTQLKAWIKDCGTCKYGVMTQCAVLSKIMNSRSILSYCENLLRKINFKNSGINTKVNLDVALKNKKSKTDSFMFFGADVIHPTNVTRQHPSIAAVVGSGDSLCSTTAVRVCQQYPNEGKCSIEAIVGLTEMVESLLDYNRQANKVLPNKVVFYRDGVDDGQFGKIIAHEIQAIRKAFDTIYGADRRHHPLLTFIVVKKRHHTRFFTYDEKTNKTDNMSVGSVIDTTIVHPYQNNFYLNSHKALQGVNHPSLYHVLLDEIGFTADELQLLTYHLCFTDPRSSAAEAIPSVVHQADIAALKARDLFYDDERSSATSVGGRSQPLVNPTLNDLTYQILNVHESLKNRPVFG